MKKTLVALAAVAATSAFAQSSVTMYGIIDLSYGTSKTSYVGAPSKKTTGIHEATLFGNRLGFRGVEDLGGGMKAGFVIETALSPANTDLFGVRMSASGHQDNAGTPVATGTTGSLHSGLSAFGNGTNRQSYASLSSSYGEVRIGYQYTNMYVLGALSGYHPGSEGPGADNAHVYGNAAVGGTRGNGLTYISPTFGGGFQVTVQYGSGQAGGIWTTDTATESGNVRTGLKLDYANGPLRAAVAHTRNKKTASNVATTGDLTQLAGSYDFGVARLVGQFSDGNNGVAGAGERDYNAHQIGVVVPFGATEFFAISGRAKTKDNVGVKTESLKLAQVGVKYSLSKRTTLFAVTGTTKDDVAAGVSGAAYKGTSTRLGVAHTF